MSIRGGKVNFAPGIFWSEVDLEREDAFREQLSQRFKGLYFEPARTLLDKSVPDDFAAGVLILCAFDAIARLWTGKSGDVAVRFKETFEKFAPNEVDGPRWSPVVYDCFRNGLVHEGRIKSVARFDSDAANCVEETGNTYIVNPKCLLFIAEAALKGLVSDNNAARFHANAIPLLQEDFEGEQAE
ncbi:MAG: hypothetical protein ABIW82_12360 [Dokdonella sp.]